MVTYQVIALVLPICQDEYQWTSRRDGCRPPTSLHSLTQQISNKQTNSHSGRDQYRVVNKPCPTPVVSKLTTKFQRANALPKQEGMGGSRGAHPLLTQSRAQPLLQRPVCFSQQKVKAGYEQGVGRDRGNSGN